MENQIKELYENWISAWNRQNADAMAKIIDENCVMIGFDGSQMNGRKEIHDTIAEIFRHHPTGLYVSIIQDVSLISADVAVLRAIVGMLPRHGQDINSSLNAVQTLLAHQKDNQWRIRFFQNTPAALHGRPELVEKMSADLRKKIPELKRP